MYIVLIVPVRNPINTSIHGIYEGRRKNNREEKETEKRREGEGKEGRWRQARQKSVSPFSLFIFTFIGWNHSLPTHASLTG